MTAVNPILFIFLLFSYANVGLLEFYFLSSVWAFVALICLISLVLDEKKADKGFFVFYIPYVCCVAIIYIDEGYETFGLRHLLVNLIAPLLYLFIRNFSFRNRDFAILIIAALFFQQLVLIYIQAIFNGLDDHCRSYNIDGNLIRIDRGACGGFGYPVPLGYFFISLFPFILITLINGNMFNSLLKVVGILSLLFIGIGFSGNRVVIFGSLLCAFVLIGYITINKIPRGRLVGVQIISSIGIFLGALGAFEFVMSGTSKSIANLTGIQIADRFSLVTEQLDQLDAIDQLELREQMSGGLRESDCQHVRMVYSPEDGCTLRPLRNSSHNHLVMAYSFSPYFLLLGLCVLILAIRVGLTYKFRSPEQVFFLGFLGSYTANSFFHNNGPLAFDLWFYIGLGLFASLAEKNKL